MKDKSPFEAWHGKKPQVDHLRTFGCVAHNIGPGINKLSDRSKKMVFLGYEAGTKGFRLLDPSTNCLHVSHDVVFEEDQSWDWSNSSSGSKVPKTFTVEF
jgi:hypothetical protein